MVVGHRSRRPVCAGGAAAASGRGAAGARGQGTLRGAGGACVSRAASAISKVRRVAPRQPVACQCCVTAVGQVGFEITSVRQNHGSQFGQ